MRARRTEFSRADPVSCSVHILPVFWLFLLFLSMAVGARAGLIRLETRLELVSGADEMTCRIVVTNTGDETALDMRATAWLGSDRESRELTQSLEPMKEAESTFKFPTYNLTDGKYHLMVRLDHSDLNGYEMSSVSSAAFTKGRSGEPVIQLVVDELVLATNGEIEARIKSSAREVLEIEYQLLMPRELVPDIEVGHLSIAPGRNYDIRIPVKNFSGLSGSEYAAFLVAEYESTQIHNSVAAPFRIRIDAEAAEPLSKRRSVLMLALVAGLAVVSVLAIFWARRM